MLLFRKFFDTLTAEPATQIQDNSIAHLMATQGVRNNSNDMVATPIIITEKKEESKQATETTPAETATSTSQTASTTSEPPTSTTEVKPVQETQIATERVEQPSWQEVLKSQQPDTVFKELGFDDKMVKLVSQLKDLDPNAIGLFEAYKEGKHVDYLRELTTDYSKMSAEEVMRHQLRKDYPTASSQQLEALFKREVTKAYSLDSEDEDEQAEGKLLLEARADKHRAALLDNQQKYLVPKFTEPQHQTETVDKAESEDVKKFEVYRSQFNDNSYTKDIFANKSISIGEGDEKFTYKVDPNAIVKVLFNGQTWMNKMSEVKDNPDGTQTFYPNAKKQFLVGMVAEYGEDFLIEYAKHFKSLGGKSAIDPIENAKPTDNSISSASQKGYETVAEAMAKQGRVNYGGN